jgi:hypothetical protein
MRNEPITTERIDNYEIEIYQDESPFSPREDENLSKMVCFHNRYNLGDKNDYNSNDYSSWTEMKDAIIENENPVVILPLYLYDHSGITISTSPFNCHWDSGQIGWVFVTEKTAKDNYGEITDEILDRITKTLLNEVETYDQYLRGEVYGYNISKIEVCNKGCEHKEELDSCWGFYGHDYCMEEAKGIVMYYNKNKEEVV